MLDTIKRILKHNFIAKVMSVFAAVVLWLFVMENENPTIERDYTIPIEVANVSDDYEYTISKKNVKIKVFAKRIYFATLDMDKIRATIDLTNAGKSGNVDVPIVIELPKGYENVEKSEETIQVALDPYIVVPVMVDIKERGSSQDLLQVSSITKTASMVEIRGTAKNTAKVNKLIGYVDLIGKDADFEQDVILIPVDNAGSEVSGIEVVHPTILAKVKMKKSVIRKTVSVKPVIYDKNGSYQASATPAFIEIEGEEKILEGISEILTVPVTPGNVTNVETKLILPEGVTSKINSVTLNIKNSRDSMTS